MSDRLQLHALYILSALAAAILVLWGFTIHAMARDAAGDGQVSGVDAGQLTVLSLMFREVIGRIQSIWEHGERADLTGKLADSAPADRPTGQPGDPVHTLEEGKKKR
jgi:hypothetical protein